MISVIIPSYNRARTIEKSARSVLNQTYTDLELIIVDDCSSDNTAEVVAALAAENPRVRYIRHEQNQGACAARNTGIDAARGEYIAFQDSDDAWRPEKLERQMAAIEQCQAEICYCVLERHNYPKSLKLHYPELPDGPVTYETFIAKAHASTQTLLVKTEVCRECHFDITLKKLQDYDWCIRAGRDHSIVFVDEVLVDVYLQEDSITSQQTADEKTIAAYEVLLAKHDQTAREYPSFALRLLSTIGRQRACLGDRSGDEYYRAYKVSGNPKHLIKHVLYKAGLLQIHYKVRQNIDARRNTAR